MNEEIPLISGKLSRRNIISALPCSSNMATFAFIPQEILEKILRFMPLRDKINSGLVCAHWNEIVGCNLQHVAIDASVPYGGRWVEQNMRWVGAPVEETIAYDDYCHAGNSKYENDDGEDDKKVWYRDENDPADKEMKNLLSKLCKITNKIKTLDIRYFRLSTDVLAELFSKQNGIKTLRIYDSLPSSAKDGYFKTIVEGIVKHQETLEVISISLDFGFPNLMTSYESQMKIKDIVCKKSLCFPKLKSFSLWPSMSEDLFLALEESVPFEEMTTGCLDSPASHDSLVADAEQLIRYYPNITYFHGRCHELERTNYIKNVLQVISKVGPQLQHLGCEIYCIEIMNAILEKCKNLESFWLVIRESLKTDQVSVIKHLIPALGCLERVTNISLTIEPTEVEAEIICGLIEKCGTNLRVLKLQFTGIDSFRILNAVGAYCKNLRYLQLIIMDRLRVEGEGDPLRTRQLKESGQAILEGCQKLISLHLNVEKRTSWATHVEPVFFDQIGKKLPHLKALTFSDNITEYPQSDLVKLIEDLPYCRIENQY